MSRAVIATIAGLCAAITAVAQPERPIRIRPEKKEPVTQALELLPDPPAAVAADSTKLTFHTSPLSNKGLLSQQIRDALRAIDRANGNARLVKIRAFIAGTGDLRRVQQIVSEDFSEKRIPLPAISTIQVGGLPMDGAQVVIEAVSEDRRAVNPGGVEFVAAASTADAQAAIRSLKEGVGAGTMLRITCFLHSFERLADARSAVAGSFPGVDANFVQLTRLGLQPLTACEGVVRAAGSSAKSAKLVFSGIQMAFREDEADLRLAFERVWKAVEAAGGARGKVVHGSTYLLSQRLAERVQKVREESGGGSHTSLVFEGLPSLDAAMAVEIVAAAP